MKITLKKGERNQLTAHLNQSEVDCQCKRADCTTTVVDTAALALFEVVRNIAGSGVNINSWYRCPAHNAEVGGAGESQHVEGAAMDISPVKRRWTPTDASVIRNTLKDYGGVGVYTTPSGDIVWIHCDSAGFRNWQVKV